MAIWLKSLKKVQNKKNLNKILVGTGYTSVYSKC